MKKGYILQVDNIQAHVLMSNNKPIDKDTLDALSALVKAAYNHVSKNTKEK